MKNVRETSIEAYKKLIDSGKLSPIRTRILTIYSEVKRDLTARDVFEIYCGRFFKISPPPPSTLQTIRARVNELSTDRLLMETGKIICSYSGMSVLKFSLLSSPPDLVRLNEEQKLEREIISMEQKLITKKSKLVHIRSSKRERWDKVESSRQTGFNLL